MATSLTRFVDLAAPGGVGDGTTANDILTTSPPAQGCNAPCYGIVAGTSFSTPFAAGVIYPAVLAGWMFLTLAFPQPDQPPAIEAALTAAIWVFAVGFLTTLIYNLALPHHESIYNFLFKKKVDKSDECK